MNLTFSWTPRKQLLPCVVCGTHTVHSQTKSGEWVCGCATIHPQETTWQIGDQAHKNLPEWKQDRNDRPFPY